MPSLTAEQQAAWSETMRPTIMGICILFLVLGNLSVPMRIWAKWRIHKRPLAEDYSLILALVGLHSIREDKSRSCHSNRLGRSLRTSSLSRRSCHRHMALACTFGAWRLRTHRFKTW